MVEFPIINHPCSTESKQLELRFSSVTVKVKHNNLIKYSCTYKVNPDKNPDGEENCNDAVEAMICLSSAQRQSAMEITKHISKEISQICTHFSTITVVCIQHKQNNPIINTCCNDYYYYLEVKSWFNGYNGDLQLQ